MWPLIKLVPKATKFRFVRFAGVAAIFSVLAAAVSFASFATGGFRQSPAEIWAAAGPNKASGYFCAAFNCGIDFRGGTLLELKATDTLDLGALRGRLAALDLGDIQVQSFGDPRTALVRFETPADGDPGRIVDEAKAAIRAGVAGVEFPRTEVVGPKVSGELFASGVTALGLAILLMLVYIWFRFEWQFGLGAVLGLFHDVILTLGLFSILRFEFTLTVIAALLTIIGYSMNDTVVVFDRLRENLRKFKKKSLEDIIDLSTNETLSRTIITGCTALLALGGLLVVGGEALFGFAFAMIFGVVIGTYSSIYVAAPAILLWRPKRGPEREAGEREPEPA